MSRTESQVRVLFYQAGYWEPGGVYYDQDCWVVQNVSWVDNKVADVSHREYAAEIDAIWYCENILKVRQPRIEEV